MVWKDYMISFYKHINLEACDAVVYSIKPNQKQFCTTGINTLVNAIINDVPIIVFSDRVVRPENKSDVETYVINCISNFGATAKQLHVVKFVHAFLGVKNESVVMLKLLESMVRALPSQSSHMATGRP